MNKNEKPSLAETSSLPRRRFMGLAAAVAAALAVLRGRRPRASRLANKEADYYERID